MPNPTATTDRDSTLIVADVAAVLDELDQMTPAERRGYYRHLWPPAPMANQPE